MNKNKLLLGSVIVLVLLNIGLISFLLFSKPPHPPKPPHPVRQEPREIIIKKLDLNEGQIKQYDVLITEHKETIQKNERQLKDLKESLYASMGKEETYDADSVIARINQVQLEIENTHYNHFMDLKKICTAEQMPKFKDLTLELAKIFSPGPKPPVKP
ncbi:MAG: periplasmic heavy metal sensor [Crocinitomicaceae bacterium]|nr:periplasmic heavy metal sensor [Crocinitomicaceae bacterium]